MALTRAMSESRQKPIDQHSIVGRCHVSKQPRLRLPLASKATNHLVRRLPLSDSLTMCRTGTSGVHDAASGGLKPVPPLKTRCRHRPRCTQSCWSCRCSWRRLHHSWPTRPIASCRERPLRTRCTWPTGQAKRQIESMKDLKLKWPSHGGLPHWVDRHERTPR